MEKVHTHYDNLKVTRNAPVQVIKAAYRVMAQQYHPDINSSPAAEKTMRFLNEAWEVLSDPVKRSAHDKWIAEEEEKSKKPTSYKAETKEQVFENAGFKYHFQTPARASGIFRPKPPPKQEHKTSRDDRRDHDYRPAQDDRQEHEDKFSPSQTRASKLGGRDHWLGLTDNQLKVIAVMAVLFFGFVIWTNIENQGIYKQIKEPNPPVISEIKEKPSDWKVIEEQPAKFVAPASIPKKEPPKQNKNPQTPFSLAEITPEETNTAKQKPIDPEQQDRTGYPKGVYQQAPSGLSKFTVNNTNGVADATARIYLNGTKPAARSMYIKSGEKFTASQLPPGSYIFRYRFIGSPKTYEADQIFSLTEVSTETGTTYSNFTVTLFTVRDGNMSVKEVPSDKF